MIPSIERAAPGGCDLADAVEEELEDRGLWPPDGRVQPERREGVKRDVVRPRPRAGSGGQR